MQSRKWSWGALVSLTFLSCSSGHPLEDRSEPSDPGRNPDAAAQGDDAVPEGRDAGASPEAGLDGGGAPGVGTGEPGVSALPAVRAEPEDPAAFLFDPAELREYALEIAPEDLARIDADPRAEEYVPATLTFEGRSYQVQARYKGSVGAFRGCVGDGGFNATGPKACTKLSMKVAFDQVDPEGRFHGLRKLQFHSMNRDPSMLKERLGYAVFRQMGLPSPRAAHARLYLNGRLNGLYALVEQVDGRFTRSRFVEGGEGNLYKEAWPIGMDRAGATESYLLEHLDTNEDEGPSVDTMLRFGAELSAASLEELPEVIGRYTDLDALLRYVATDRAIAHDDGPFHWYCGGTGGSCYNHNYFVYEEAGLPRVWLIVWDLDSVFNLDNAVTTLAFPWDDTSLGCGARVVPPATLPVVPPACDKLTLGLASLQERYLAALAEVLQGPLHVDRVEPQLQAWEEQLEPSVAELAALHADAVTPDAWLAARQSLRGALESLRKRAAERIHFGPVAVRDPFGS